MEAFDGIGAASQVLFWLPGRFVMVFPLDQVCQTSFLVLTVYVEDLLELPSLLDVSIVVTFDDAA
jgi:hypothetical protein